MKTILVIEDNNEVRENIEEILALSNYKILSASNGKVGVEMALEKKPDLIVCDIMMPTLDGYGVLHLLSKNCETATIPFIFLTAKSEKSDWRKGMELGADDYLTKPFDGTELLSAVEARLKKSDNIKQQLEKNANELKEFINVAKGNTEMSLINDKHEVYSYKKKEILFKEGQKPKAVYYVMSGKVKLYKTNPEGKELITNILIKGNFFGYHSLLQEVNYKENAEILEDAELMLINREEFLELLTSNNQIAKQFIKLMTHEILEKEEHLLNLAYNSLRKKVAYGLVQLMQKFSPNEKGNIVFNLSRENLAQITGVATESLIRTISDFKSEGILDIKDSKIVIRNPEKLRDLLYSLF